MQASDQAITYGRAHSCLGHIRHPHHCRAVRVPSYKDWPTPSWWVVSVHTHWPPQASSTTHHGVGVDFCLGYSYAITPVIGPMHAWGIRKCRQGIESRTSSQRRTGHGTVPADGDALLFLGAHGTTRRASPEIRPYYIVVALSIPIQSLFNAFSNSSTVYGNTRTPMWIMISANLFQHRGKLPADLRYRPFPTTRTIRRRHLYHRHASMLMVIYGIFTSNEKYKKISFRLPSQGETTDMRRLLHKLGRPLRTANGHGERLRFSLCAVMQGWIGAAPLAAHQIMTSVGSTCFMVYYGIRAAVAIQVSHFHGVNDTRNVRRSSLTGYLMILATGLALAITISTFITDICALSSPTTRTSGILSSAWSSVRIIPIR